jgi:ribose transport system ATP-binding protein
MTSACFLAMSGRKRGMDRDDAMILRMQGICKQFPGVRALDNVSFALRAGEVHVLLGENGAGKSTLIKIISGAYSKDQGDIFLNEERTEIENPRHAQELGIATVYQEFNLVPFLSVAENIFLGRQPMKGKVIRVIDKARMNSQATSLLRGLDIDVNPRTLIRHLGVASKQMVEIARVFAVQAKICIFDEPTATLTSQETQRLFEVIRKFKAEGIGIIYISHRLEEVFEIGDRITVMRNGKYVGTTERAEVSAGELVEMMIGRKTGDVTPRTSSGIGKEVLRVENLRGKRFRDINLSVRAGEIVGLAGLVGAGRTEVLRAIFGADKPFGGAVFLNGHPCRISSPRSAVSHKIALLPEDRKKDALVLCRSVEENVTLSSLDSVARLGVLSKSKISSRVRSFVEKLKIRTPSTRQLVAYLSGGNQQKVIIARWLCAESDLVMFDEPTRGIDVGTKPEVHNLMFEMAAGGKAILVVSSEIPELLKVCDRIYVMHEGRIAVELKNKNLTSDTILHAAFGRPVQDLEEKG